MPCFSTWKKFNRDQRNQSKRCEFDKKHIPYISKLKMNYHKVIGFYLFIWYWKAMQRSVEEKSVEHRYDVYDFLWNKT